MGSTIQRYADKATLLTRAKDTESFLAAVAGTLGDDFPDDITDDDLGTDVPRNELD